VVTLKDGSIVGIKEMEEDLVLVFKWFLDLPIENQFEWAARWHFAWNDASGKDGYEELLFLNILPYDEGKGEEGEEEDFRKV
jgi:hypothetical protein